MCGICGIYNFEKREAVSRPDLEKMNNRLTHRGPDDEGYHIDNEIGLAMRRLSIIDVEGGHQPVCDEKGKIWLVLNGEIYNYRELRAELSARGHKFKTKSDSEVIVHLYEEKGIDCVKELRGMFAFALWDGKWGKFHLVRDRIGQKPLNYYLENGKLAFASELQALTALDFVSREMNPEAINLYLSLQYIPSPLTIYKSIGKLPPGHILTVYDRKVSIGQYWDLPTNRENTNIDFESAKQEIVKRLRESVKLRMISDVPIGAFLSGGIDSSVIVALMSEVSSSPIKTFSIGFKEQEFSELEYAKEVASMYGCDHNEFIVSPEMTDVLPKLARHYGEPYADSSALPSYYLSRETGRHVKVALNGDGGDENFAGYLRYVAMNLGQYWDVIPGPFRKMFSVASSVLPEKNAPFGFFWRLKRFLSSMESSDIVNRHLGVSRFFSESDKQKLFTEEFKARLGSDREFLTGEYFQEYFKHSGESDFINRLLYADIKTYLPDCLMTKTDIASMANSLEARSPFLDHKFMEFAFGLKGDWKLKGIRDTKWILKEAFKYKLPKSIVNRKKMGFGIPLGKWFREDLKCFWEQICLSSQALSREYFEEAELKSLWHDHQIGRKDNGYKLWALLMLELWFLNENQSSSHR
jgi:asparagine synthase (glutamine-hydrolysing)